MILEPRTHFYPGQIVVLGLKERDKEIPVLNGNLPHQIHMFMVIEQNGDTVSLYELHLNPNSPHNYYSPLGGLKDKVHANSMGGINAPKEFINEGICTAASIFGKIDLEVAKLGIKIPDSVNKNDRGIKRIVNCMNAIRLRLNAHTAVFLFYHSRRYPSRWKVQNHINNAHNRNVQETENMTKSALSAVHQMVMEVQPYSKYKNFLARLSLTDEDKIDIMADKLRNF